ncbi:MAG: hypothetical protein H5T84_10160, partial [Thermoleophilia bacterium]|nr:hypothetical protein [Thermoleophilia bacterium]
MLPAGRGVRPFAAQEAGGDGLVYASMDAQVVARLFAADKQRRDAFMRFLSQGYEGVVWHREGEWAAYGWLTLPHTLGPPHLPRSIQRLQACWLFYFHTRESYRRRGLYRATLELLVDRA